MNKRGGRGGRGEDGEERRAVERVHERTNVLFAQYGP